MRYFMLLFVTALACSPPPKPRKEIPEECKEFGAIYMSVCEHQPEEETCKEYADEYEAVLNRESDSAAICSADTLILRKKFGW